MIMKHNGSVLSIELYKDKHNHTHKKRDLEVISRSTRFKEFNREKKQQQKHRISLKSFRESGHVMLVLALQNFATVVSLLSLNKLHFRYFRSSSSRTTVDSNFFHGPIEFEMTRVNCS